MPPNTMITDVDPTETHEWLESIQAVLRGQGPARAQFLLGRLIEWGKKEGVVLPFTANTPYVNTIPVSEQPPYPGDLPYQIPNAVTFESLTNIRALLGDIDVIETQENGLLAADDKKALEGMRRDVWNWMSEQIEESADRLAVALKDEMYMAPDGDSSAIHRELEANEESFITEGVD